jgi:hypothetical protein
LVPKPAVQHSLASGVFVTKQSFVCWLLTDSLTTDVRRHANESATRLIAGWFGFLTFRPVGRASSTIGALAMLGDQALMTRQTE